MKENVAIIGIGQTQFKTISPDMSYKELMFDAAVKAYNDAGVNPRKDVGSFISAAEDFWEGTSIFDEYVPDQIGAAMRPVCNIVNESLHALISGAMQILTGVVDVVAVESHSKLSEVVYPDNIMAFALDPLINRPLKPNPHALAGLEMTKFLYDTGNSKEDCANVVVKNKGNAMQNPVAAYGAEISIDDVLFSDPISSPLGQMDMSEPADGSIVIIMASEDKANKMDIDPIWISGMGWCNDTPSLETRDWGATTSAEISASMAYEMAGIKSPMYDTSFAEVDDTYSYKELQHLEAVGVCKSGEAGNMLSDGIFDLDGQYPVNTSGGSLGLGHLLDANGLAKVADAVLQLRGHAGPRQIPDAWSCIVQGWRGVPTTSTAMMVLHNDDMREVR
jgi:acetyl-CoA C-acetyltransferase